MASSATAAWQRVARLAQECVASQHSSAEQQRAHDGVLLLVAKLGLLPQQPKAVWKKLLQLKVCCTLAWLLQLQIWCLV